MRKSGKLLSIALVLCMVFSLLPTAALADGEVNNWKDGLFIEYDDLCGGFTTSAVTYGADGATITVTVDPDKLNPKTIDGAVNTAIMAQTAGAGSTKGGIYGETTFSGIETAYPGAIYKDSYTSWTGFDAVSDRTDTAAKDSSPTKTWPLEARSVVYSDGWKYIGQIAAVTDGSVSAEIAQALGSTTPSYGENYYFLPLSNYTCYYKVHFLDETFDVLGTVQYKVVIKTDLTDVKTAGGLAAAVAAAPAGSTITLGADVTLTDMITLNKSITIDLSGHKLSHTTGNSIVQVINNATLTIDGTTAGSQVYGRVNLGIADNNNGNAVLNSGSYSCANAQTVLHINGTCKDSDVTISGATINSPTDNGIQLNGAGTFEIEDSTITGATGVYIKAGTLTVKNSTITGTMSPANYSYYGNGANATGDALVVDACNYPGGDPTVNIQSGAFSGTKAAIGYYRHTGSDATAVPGTATITITGGYFTADPTAYLADGKAAGASEISGYAYKVIDAEVANIAIKVGEPTVKPVVAPTDKPAMSSDETDLLTTAAGGVAPDPTDTGLAAAANIPASNVTESQAEVAAKKLAAALGSATTDQITVVVQPKLVVTPKYYDDTEKILTLDIKAEYDLIATTNPENIKLGDTDKNAVKVNDESLPMTVPANTEVKLKVEIPAAMAVETASGSGIFNPLTIKHQKENGDVFYYEAAVTRAGEATNYKYFATFTVTNGFSEFTAMAADTRTLAVTYDPNSVTGGPYSITNVGDTLPTATKSGYTFTGWKFDGVDGTYTKLTDELWGLLMPSSVTGNNTVTATAQFSTPSYYIPSTPTPTPGMKNFVSDAGKYTTGMFTDVTPDAWYGESKQGCIKSAVMLGIMEGYGDGIFKPEAELKVSEAIKMACMVYSIYSNDGEKFVQGEPWYKVYVDYAVKKGIIASDSFTDLEAVCTRGGAAFIFANALPEKELAAKNTVNSLPDVAAGDKYAGEILTLYKAGVLGGNDAKGSFGADGAFNRAQAAAVITRLCVPGSRLDLTF